MDSYLKSKPRGYVLLTVTRASRWLQYWFPATGLTGSSTCNWSWPLLLGLWSGVRVWPVAQRSTAMSQSLLKTCLDGCAYRLGEVCGSARLRLRPRDSSMSRCRPLHSSVCRRASHAVGEQRRQQAVPLPLLRHHRRRFFSVSTLPNRNIFEILKKDNLTSLSTPRLANNARARAATDGGSSSP